MKKIIVVGSINTDLVISADRMPKAGETVKGRDFFIARGGKGANQAIAASRLGGSVVMCGCVGNDDFGLDALRSLEKDNVDTRFVRVKDGSTGTAVILLSDSNNRIIVNGGANLLLAKEDIDNVLTEAQQGDIYLTQAENPIEVIGYGMKKAKEKGLTVLLNPAPANKELLPFLPYCDILLPNETEAALLGEENIKNVPILLTTLGEKGFEIAQNDKKTVYPCKKITPVDTTAAGDTFCGCLAARLASDCPLVDAALFSSLAATIACTVKGAQPSIPHLMDVLDAKLD